MKKTAILIFLFASSLAAQVQIGKGVQIGGVGSDITLTTTGSSGPATLTDSVLNIPVYSGGGMASGSVFVAAPTPNSTTNIQAIGNGTNQVVNIVANGDSFNRCSQVVCPGPGNGPTLSINREAERLRTNLQGQYGSHGGGQLPIASGIGSAPEPIDPSAWAITGTYDTNVIALGPFQGSLGTLFHLATGAVATYNDARALTYGGGNVYFATSSSSGTITIRVDGTTVATASATSFTTAGTVNGGFTARMLTLPSFTSSTSHVVTFTSSGDTYLFSFESTNGTTGVSVHNTSFGGSTAASVGSSAASQNAFNDLIPGGPQVEYIQFLTNDAAGGGGTTNFGTFLTNAITHYQTLPRAPTVIIAISPVDIVNGTDPEGPYTAVMQGLCTSLSLTCVNFQTQGQTLNSVQIGFSTNTPLSSNPWWDFTGAAWPGGNAGVHPSDIGAVVEGNLLTGALTNPQIPNSGGGCAVNCAFSGTGSTPAITTTSAATNTAVFNSTSANGSGITIQGSATGVDSWVISSGSPSVGPVVGSSLLIGDQTTGIFSSRTSVNSIGAGQTEVPSLNIYCWSSTSSVTANGCDTGISRGGANTLDIGNGGPGDTSGTLNLGVLNASSANTAITASTSNFRDSPIVSSNTGTGISGSPFVIGPASVAPNVATGQIFFGYVGIDGTVTNDFFGTGFVDIAGTGSTLNYGFLGITPVAIGSGISRSGLAVCNDGSIASGLIWGATCPQTSGGYTGPSITDAGLTSGNCVQASTGGLLTTTGAPCGSGGSGPTIQTNGTSNTLQTTLNFITSTLNSTGLTITPSNPATGNEKFEIGGALTYDQLGSGTNLSHGLVCGNGCVNTTAGTGIINANELNGVLLSGLATGLLKNTTSTGVPSIATAGTDYQAPITLTTTGTSGAATFSAGTLNIPNYGTPAFSSLSGGMNTTAGMVVGSGASLGVSGTGTIAATSSSTAVVSSDLAGGSGGEVPYQHSASLTQFDTNFAWNDVSHVLSIGGGLTLASGTTMTSQSSANSQIVTCPTGGTGTQICDASGAWIASGGAPAFSAITGATNTTAAMLVGTGASLGVTGTGTIGATALLGNTWAAPGAIGGTTPGAGTFTTGSFGGQLTALALGTAVSGTNFGSNTVAVQGSHFNVSAQTDTFGCAITEGTGTTPTITDTCGITTASTGVTQVIIGSPNGFVSTGGVKLQANGRSFTFYEDGSAQSHLMIDGGRALLLDTPMNAPTYQTLTNCTSTASPAVCAAAAAGIVQVAATATTLTVNTTAVTANSRISFTFSTVGITAPTNVALLVEPYVSAITAGTSFTITLPVAPAANPVNVTYTIVN